MVEFGVYASRVIFFLLICFSFKWRKLAHYYFACEIFVNALEAFQPFANHDLMVNLRYTYLVFNYWSLAVTDFKMNMLISFLYVCIFVYAQTVAFNDVSAMTVLFSNVPQAA